MKNASQEQEMAWSRLRRVTVLVLCAGLVATAGVTPAGAVTPVVEEVALVGATPLSLGTAGLSNTASVAAKKDARKPTAITISRSKTAVTKNKRVKLTVHLTRSGKAYANKQIKLHYRAQGNKKWVPIGVQRTSKTGKTSFRSPKLSQNTQFRATFGGTKAFRSATSPAVTVRTVKTVKKLPKCTVSDVETKHRKQSDWSRTLVDHQYTLPITYRPKDLVPVSRAGIRGSGNIRKIVVKDLKALSRDAAKAGAPLEIRSAYRSYATQQTTFKHWVRVNGKERALRVSARPGHSEHQLGTALDFNTRGARTAPWVGDWGKTKSGAWMKKNAWKYGFVMSYPSGERAATCYNYEPWHYRYVGKQAALEIRDREITLREYLWEQQ